MCDDDDDDDGGDDCGFIDVVFAGLVGLVLLRTKRWRWLTKHRKLGHTGLTRKTSRSKEQCLARLVVCDAIYMQCS